MTKKLVVFFLFLLFLITPQFSFAEETSDLNQKITEYTQKLNQLGTAKNTLSNQIKILDSQVQLTLLKITQTENTIKTLEKEINGLNVEIDKLNINLNDLSVIFINQIIQNYKLQKRVPAFAYIFSSNLNDFLEQHKYITILQKDSQTNLINMETTRTNYDIQKTSKEKKQAELEELQKTLANQKISLNSQKASKNSLLEITKNDEKKYQQLLNVAIAQLNAFASFTSGGGSLLSNQTRCDSWGCYFNQRDSDWGNIVFGWSSDKNGNKIYYNMKGYGCLVTSTTMILTHYGKSIKPSDLANESNLFFGHSGDMLQGNMSINGFSFTRNTIGYSLSSADSELAAGRPVIAGVNGSSAYPAHFIVIKSKENGEYLINDPYPENGYNKTLSSTNYVIKRIDSIRVN